MLCLTEIWWEGLSLWYKAEWIHAFMLFHVNFDPTTQMLQQKLRLIRPGNIFPIFLRLSCANCTAASVSCFLVAGVSVCWWGPVCLQGLICSYLHSEILFTSAVTSGYLSYHWLYQLEAMCPLISQFWTQQGIFTQRTIASWIFSRLLIILWKLLRWFPWSAVSEILRSWYLTDTNNHSDAQFEL